MKKQAILALLTLFILYSCGSTSTITDNEIDPTDESSIERASNKEDNTLDSIMLIDSIKQATNIDSSLVPVEKEITFKNKTFCFKSSEKGIEIDGQQYYDVTAVQFTLSDQGLARGTFDWMPAEKDWRRGQFTGTYQDGSIKALYSFTQEGDEYAENIQIVFNDYKCSVKGTAPDFGDFNDIPKIECEPEKR